MKQDEGAAPKELADVLQASDKLASRCEPAMEDKSQASKVTFAWKNRNRWE